VRSAQCEFSRNDDLSLYAGTVGGFVSSQRRMQNVPSEGDPLVSAYGLASASYYLWLSPLLGAIFAAVLAMMFIAGFLKGTVFPEFYRSINSGGLPFFHFTWNTLPTSSEEYAKLLVCAFLAGFAERLVPDSLDRLTLKINAGQKDAMVPPAPPLFRPWPMNPQTITQNRAVAPAARPVSSRSQNRAQERAQPIP